MSHSGGNSFSGSFFITSVTHHRKPYFSDEHLAQLVSSQWKRYERAYSFHLNAFCVMFDHYHVVLQVGEKKTVSQIVHAVNSFTATLINQQLANKRKVKIWGRSPWYVGVRNEEMYWQKIAYTLFNPWREGLVNSSLDPFQGSNLDEWLMREGREFVLDLFSKYKRWFE